MMKYLDDVLPEYLFVNLLTAEQAKVFGDAIQTQSLGKLQNTTRPDLHKEFIIDKDKAGEYMAKILGYDLKNAPSDGYEDTKKLSEFMKSILHSIKQKLAIFSKF